MSGVTEAVPLAKSLPGIVQFMQRVPLGMIRVINPLIGCFFDYSKVSKSYLPVTALGWLTWRLFPLLTVNPSQLIREQVATICNQHENIPDASSMVTKEKPSRTTVFHDLLESHLPAQEKSEERLTQEGVGLVSAAAETTSTALAATMFHLLSDSDLVTRLRNELRTVMPSSDVSPEWSRLETLPLLVIIIAGGLSTT